MIVVLLENGTNDTFVDTPIIDIYDSLVACLLLNDGEYGLRLIEMVRTDTLHVGKALAERARKNEEVTDAVEICV